MTFADELEQLFPKRIERPSTVADITPNNFYVYILTIDDQAVVVGHGRKNRARVIFDSADARTANHIKAMTVRLYCLYGGREALFERYLIQCATKTDAQEVEHLLHSAEFCGGNTLIIPSAIEEALLAGLKDDSPVRMVLRIALSSAYDGIADLKRWRRQGIIPDSIWKEIAARLQL
ncbi:MAG: hypothetical protein AB7F88_17500 [Pyrinomonadaceae bacterium]